MGDYITIPRACFFLYVLKIFQIKKFKFHVNLLPFLSYRGFYGLVWKFSGTNITSVEI